MLNLLGNVTNLSNIHCRDHRVLCALYLQPGWIVGKSMNIFGIATLLLINKRFARFQSNINFKVFSVARGEGKRFEFVELLPDDVRFIYHGDDEETFKRKIVQELTDEQ